MDPGTLLLIAVAVLVVWLLVDLFFAGGAMTSGVACGVGGMMGAVGGMMSTPIGWLLLIVAALLAYGLFFR